MGGLVVKGHFSSSNNLIICSLDVWLGENFLVIVRVRWKPVHTAASPLSSAWQMCHVMTRSINARSSLRDGEIHQSPACALANSTSPAPSRSFGGCSTCARNCGSPCACSPPPARQIRRLNCCLGLFLNFAPNSSCSTVAVGCLHPRRLQGRRSPGSHREYPHGSTRGRRHGVRAKHGHQPGLGAN